MLFSWEGLSTADNRQQIAKTIISICLLCSKSRAFTRPWSVLLTCKDPSVKTMPKIKGSISWFIGYNPCKVCLSFSHKLWHKFGTRCISRIGSLRFWSNSVKRKALCALCVAKRFSRKNAGNSRFSTQISKGRVIITTWHLLRSPKILCYIVDWSICYPLYVLDLR